MSTDTPDVSTSAPQVPTDNSNNVPDQLPLPPSPQQAAPGSTADLENRSLQNFTSPDQSAVQQSNTPQKPSLWRSLLEGALTGLAAAPSGRGQSGGQAFAGGLAAGTGAQLAKPAQQAQQQAALDNEKAMTAYHYANLVHIQREINLMPDDKREQYLNQATDQSEAMIKSGAATPLSQPSDIATAQQALQRLHAQNPWAVYSIAPTRDENGNLSYMAVQFGKAPLQSDLTLEGAGANGQDVTIPAGTPADQVGKYYSAFLSKKIEAETKQNLSDSKAADALNLQNVKGAQQMNLQNVRGAQAQQRAATAAAGTNVVAFDPEYQNPDGSTGANVVLDRATAQQRGLFNYKVDPSVVNANVAGFNDVQTKINQLAAVANDAKRMSAIQPELAAAILAHGKGIEVGAFGTHLDTSRVNEGLYKEDVAKANQATRDYVTALVAAHEAITQLPRLQTFGKSSRMTQQQMEAAQNMLPHPGDGPQLAAQKMDSLQTTIDPLRKQLPHMPGAELIPSWREQRAKPPAATHTFNPSTGQISPVGGQ